MAKFRKRPLVITAMQFDGTIKSARSICKWANADALDDPICAYITHDGDKITAHDFLVDTLEGPLQASVGDWIIRGVAGEFYPCKPDIFAATYEPVLEGGGDGAAE